MLSVNSDHTAAASSDFDIFNLFDTDDIELSPFCEKMDTENNLINTADIFDIFNLFDTDGGLKDLELKNKKLTHYCQEDMFCITFTYYKKGALAHLLKEQKTFENIHIYITVIMSTPLFFYANSAIFQLYPDKRSCPCLYGANQVSRIQGTCSKGTDETVLTKFITVTDGQTGQKQYMYVCPGNGEGGRHNYSNVYMNIFERLLFFQKFCQAGRRNFP
jgi:hypothetical protein